MRVGTLNVLVCPACRGAFELVEETVEEQEIITGKLYCSNCKRNFLIVDGVPVFGMRTQQKDVRLKEISGENKWVYEAIPLQGHLDFARSSAESGERTIQKLNDRINKQQGGGKRVLDLGSGWGCFQSWQFAKHNFDVIAAELCPEFVFASDHVSQEAFFERIITDCTALPFQDSSFDIVFCKELVHHIDNPIDLFGEIQRVSSPNGLIVVREPCVSKLLKAIVGEDEASAVGITHYGYTYGQYLKYMKRIVSDIQIVREILVIDQNLHPRLSIFQKPILAASRTHILGSLISKVYLVLFGGSVELIGATREDKTGDTKQKGIVQVTDIELGEINVHQIEFYRENLIPEVMKIFQEIHNRIA